MALYIIAIGGTGAKCVEAVLHTAAIGIFTNESIWILFVDQDEANGNVTRAKTTGEAYKRCYDLFKGDTQLNWMQTEINIVPNVWSPVREDNKTLGSFFNYNSYKNKNPKIGHLFDVLFTEAERDTSLEDGFLARPAIGSAVMSQLNLEQENSWKTLIDQIKKDDRAKVFLYGSVFGGTGASGLPTISRLIASHFQSKIEKKQIEIGGLLMLPYFTFPVTQAPTNRIYADPDRFLINTEVALRYYKSQARNQAGQSSEEGYIAFDAIYLLGMPELSQVNNKFSLGRNGQQNNPHIIELYAALAAQHFLLSTPKNKVITIRRDHPNLIAWGDIPKQNQVKQKLVNATRFALAWTKCFFPELNKKSINIKNFAKNNPWFENFFAQNNHLFEIFFASQNAQKLPGILSDNEQDVITQVNKWCKSYLDWLEVLNRPESIIKLFKFSDLVDLDGLVLDEVRKKPDTFQRLKNQLEDVNDRGAVGLAKALYKLCE